MTKEELNQSQDECELTDEALEETSGGIGYMPGFPPREIFREPDNDKPRDGGATGSW